MTELQSGRMNQQLQTLLGNLTSILGRPRARRAAVSAAQTAAKKAEEAPEVDQLCDQIAAEYERIQRLQAVFGYPSSSFRS